MVKCIDCKNNEYFTNFKGEKMYYCADTGFISTKEEVTMDIQCEYYDPIFKEPDITGLSRTELTLFKFLKKIGGSIAVYSLPSNYRGALGKLKRKGLVSSYQGWIKSKTPNGKFVYKNVKMIMVNEENK